MDKEKATRRIAELRDEAMAKIRQAQEIADETGIGFSFDIAYGMGGFYMPSTSEDTPYRYDDEYGWQPSSQSC